jgi:putative membrane protein
MAQTKIRIALAIVLGIAGVAACDKSESAPPPQTPAAQTTTTGATDQYNQPSAPGVTDTSGVGASGSTTSIPMSGVTGNTPSPGMSPSATTPSGIAPTASDVPASGGDGSAASLSDSQIVAVVHGADSGEIDQAHEAIRKGKNARVKHFAQHMLTDHSAAETKLSSIESKGGITPQTSAIAEHVKSNGDEILSNLKSSSSGSDFDKAYIDAQVKEHTKVLDLLDNKLVPQAQNADLLKTLKEIRTKVASHLQEAQDIQASLAK